MQKAPRLHSSGRLSVVQAVEFFLLLGLLITFNIIELSPTFFRKHGVGEEPGFLSL